MRIHNVESIGYYEDITKEMNASDVMENLIERSELLRETMDSSAHPDSRTFSIMITVTEL